MSIETKQIILKNLEKELGHTLTVDNNIDNNNLKFSYNKFNT